MFYSFFIVRKRLRSSRVTARSSGKTDLAKARCPKAGRALCSSLVSWFFVIPTFVSGDLAMTSGIECD